MLLDPTVAIITNIDPEHLEYWGSMDALVQGFREFAGKVPFFGFSALCLDHPVVQSLIPSIRRKTVTYGLGAQAEVRGESVSFDGIDARFQVRWQGEALGQIHLAMPGEHNVCNALAAIAVGLELDIPFDRIQAGLEGFTGVDRRFSVRSDRKHPEGDITIIDDYGHHPTEIRATLGAAAQAWPDRRIVAVFQPHRYTRVRDLMDDFQRAFNDADQVVVCPVYRAGEKPIEGVDHDRIAAGMIEHGHRGVTRVGSLDEASAHLIASTLPGDVVITLGAGDVAQICAQLREGLDARS